jgi:FtsP/CotA-like multicopper oxidase with cupredoxin domain
VYISKRASRARLREAQNARNNRAEIVKALSVGQVSRREIIKWGAFTAGGALALKNGLSPFARSAFADIPTGTPRSPLFGVEKFSQRMPRLNLQTPLPLTRNFLNQAMFPFGSGLPNAKRYSYHNEFNLFPGPVQYNPFRNPITNRGPMEGRPPGEFFAHQRWNEFFPKVGYVMSWGQCAPGTRFHPGFPDQNPNSVWTYGSGKFVQGVFPPPLIKGRYGEPILTRMYNNTPVSRDENGGFGRNETQLHFHNAHNAGESDGATAAHHFPGTFYDYLWSTALARQDTINVGADDPRASGPHGFGIEKVPGDFRELQGTMWFHDHRFFFTSNNVYKGALGMVNYYSGPDRGHETIGVGGNLKLPSGNLLPWGNIDFDVNLILSDGATDPDGQYFFDIFTTDGFLGDLPLVNFAYAPYFEVLPRKYRFRLLNACMSRFWKFMLSYNGSQVPFQFIANDGNLVVNPLTLTELDDQGVAERYDIVVDFSAFPVGSAIQLVNVLRMRDDGRGPDVVLGPFTLAEALAGVPSDPCIGPVMEFRVVSHVESVDLPGFPLSIANSCGSHDRSQVPLTLTEQIPIVEPVRTRQMNFGRGGGDPRDPVTGQCVPDCPDEPLNFPWTIRITANGIAGVAHNFNANRISLLIPKPGEVEHWTLIGAAAWDHPVHMHFEEGVTIDRGPDPIPDTERLVRKDVWRLRSTGVKTVTFQVRFGEFGGAYVTHCHNTVHEDFAMLLRLQILAGGGTQAVVTPTPNATPDGVFFSTPEILPEGDPRESGTT